MGRWRIIYRLLIFFGVLTVGTLMAQADEYRHVGDYLLKSHFKLTGSKITPIPIKAIAFRVYTDGVTVKVTTEGDDEAHTKFEIYRSDGISRQRSDGGAIEIIPGLQAMSSIDGVLRHLRLSAESMTITTFPSVSNQTIVSYSIAAQPIPKIEKAKSPSTPSDQPPIR